jgi:hypothetical protein
MVLLHNVAFFCYDFFQADEKDETHFHTIVNCITQSLKTQIIGRSYDEVAICFFNTVCAFSTPKALFYCFLWLCFQLMYFSI